MHLYYCAILLSCCVIQFCCADPLSTALERLSTKLTQLSAALTSASKKSKFSGVKLVTTLPIPTKSAVHTSPPSYEHRVEYDFLHASIELAVQDITTMTQVQAIVNAANAGLQAGDGVCGAIYAAAGSSELTTIVDNWKKLNNKLNGINVGQAALTGVPFGKVNKLPSNIQYIVHAVGPNCTVTTEKANWKKLLADAYTNSLIEADKKKVHSIAFPSISTAIFGCNPDEAAPVALQAVLTYFEQHPKSSIQKVVFVFWVPGDTYAAEDALKTYEAIIDATFGIA